MILHVLLLRPKLETTREALLAVLEQARALPEHIPGLLDVQAGENTSQSNQGYTYGLVMRFEDEAALRAYSPHPAHKAVSSQLRQLCEVLLNFDLPEE
jgi:hypothetical protein